jgi:hypothetical protein
MEADATKVTKPPLKPATRYAWFLLNLLAKKSREYIISRLKKIKFVWLHFKSTHQS